MLRKFLAVLLSLTLVTIPMTQGTLLAEPAPKDINISQAFEAEQAAYEEGVFTAEIGNVRVQILSDTLVRIELKGPNGYEDRPTYHIVNRDWPGTAAAKTVDTNTTKIETENYTVTVPNTAASLSGISITDKKGTEIWKYTELPAGNPYLPAPGATPKAWAIADNPRVVPPEWGYNPQPSDNTNFTDLNGWDSANNAPDMYIFMPKGDAKQLRKDFVSLTGDSELIPLKSLGLWHSRWFAYTDQEVYDMIDKYREEGFPLDNFVVDTDWRVNASIGYDINTNCFPDMAAFFKTAHEEKNVSIMFNDHPEPQGNQHVLSKQDLEYRNTNLRKLLNMGLDTWWYDRNWSVALISPFNGIPKESLGMYLYQWITQDAKPNDRPFIMGNIDGIDNGFFNRAPNLASHRFSHQWTGDITTGPDSLKREIENVVRSGAITSTPYISADIGGHTAPTTTDMYIRWSQFATFSPFFRYHCTQGTGIFREPWNYGEEAEDIARDYINMRYRMLPLFYALSHENYGTGIPITKRLDYEYPGYAEAQDDTEYTLGDGVLIAPLWEGLTTNAIPVPSDWLKTNDGQTGLSAQYFNNMAISGEPALTRTDAQVNFNWDQGSPDSIINTNRFSAVWTGNITIGSEDAYLAVTSDDGVRLYVDDELVADNWQDNAGVTTITKEMFAAGSTHTIRIEYFENSGGASISLGYITVADGNQRTVFIPDGRWIDAWTGAQFTGPQTITVSHMMETMPMFIRSGTVVPLVENVSYIGEKPWDEMSLDVYPSTKLKGTQTVYEDDGKSNDYKKGLVRATDLETSFDNGDVVVKISPANGSFDGDDQFSARTWNVRVHAPASWGALEGVSLNGKDASGIVEKINKDVTAMPFAFEGGAPDSDVYVVTFTADLKDGGEVRMKFATPQDEKLPSYSDIPVDVVVTEKNMGAAVDLTVTGTDDWAHFGSLEPTTVVRKQDGGKIIGDLNITGTPQSHTNVFTAFHWTDGDITETADNVSNAAGISDGKFELDLKVGPETKKFSVYLGGTNSSGRLQISDGTNNGANVVNLSNLSGNYINKIEITASAEQETVLRLTYAKTDGTGLISFMAVCAYEPSIEPDLSVTRFAYLEESPESANLSDPKNIDWVHLGLNMQPNTVNRKNNVLPLLTAPTYTNRNVANDYYTKLSFDDGTPTESATNSGDTVWTTGTIQFSAASTTAWRQLKVYLGAYLATNKIEIFDDSGTEVTSFEYSDNNVSRKRCLTVVFRSESDAMLNIRMTCSGQGNISLAGYALSELEDNADNIEVSIADVPGTLNLSDDRFAEWAHFGKNNASAVNRKKDLDSYMIGTPKALIGSIQRGNDFKTAFTWSDGTPDLSQNTGLVDFVYSFDGVEMKLNMQPGTWKASVYTSVWWSKGLIEVLDSSGGVVGVTQYESKIATAGSSEYKKIDIVYGSDKAQELTFRIVPALAFDGHRGNASIAAVTIEKLEKDLSELSALVADVEAFIASNDLLNYIPKDVDALITALNLAKEVLASEAPTQDEIKAATAGLSDAMASLTLNPWNAHAAMAEEGNTIRISGNVDNNTGIETKIVVIAAAYDATGKLITSEMKEIDSNDTDVFDFTFDLSDGSQIKSVKVFIWTQDGFVPLISPVEPMAVSRN